MNKNQNSKEQVKNRICKASIMILGGAACYVASALVFDSLKIDNHIFEYILGTIIWGLLVVLIVKTDTV